MVQRYYLMGDQATLFNGVDEKTLMLVSFVSPDYICGEEAEDHVRRPMTGSDAFPNGRPVDANDVVVS